MMRGLLTCCVFLFILCSCSLSSTQSTQAPTAVSLPEVTRLDWEFEGNKGVEFITPYWDIHSTIPVPRIVDSLPDFYADLLEHYTSVFGDLPYPDKRIDVFLFANEKQWQQKLQEMIGDEAKEWFSLGRGGLTVDGVGVLYHLDKRGRSRVTLRIAAHEGWHQYAEAVFKNCLPTWLDEGIGTWMEGFRIRSGNTSFTPSSNWDRLTTLRKIVSADRLDSLTYLLESDPSALLANGRTTLLSYYAQLWALTSFIVEYEHGKYVPALRSVLNSALAGTLREPRGGWLYAFTDKPHQMEQEYKDWVVQYAKPGTSWR
jgi:hypothetical protein